MGRRKLLNWISAQAEENRMACRRILDALILVERGNGGSCTHFLSPEEQRAANSVIAHFPNVQLRYYPKQGERRVLCISQSYENPLAYLDIQLLRIRGEAPLEHRHILGAALATGIERDRLGDIRIAEKEAEIMVKDSVADFLQEELQQIGKQTVYLTRADSPEFSLSEPEGETFRVFVASPRLDAVVAAITRQARGKAQAMIRQGRIKRNHTVEYDTKRLLTENDVLSVRGFGRFTLLSEGEPTRKGNRVFTVSHTK